MEAHEATPDRAVLAIIGGGFCGTLAAIRLLDRTPGVGLPAGSCVVLVEPGVPGQGLAYRSGPDHWLLNVPANRMSAFTEAPGDFLEYARNLDPQVSGDDFLPRALYGRYLADRLHEAVRRAASRLEFEHLDARAVDIEELADSGDSPRTQVRLQLSNGTSLVADRVLLAIGNRPASASICPDDEGLIHSPWTTQWIDDLPQDNAQVVLIGTGLTMVDLTLSVAAARPNARIVAISRHGLLPRPQLRSRKAIESSAFGTRSALQRGPLNLRLRRLRRSIEVAARSGEDWRDSIQHAREVIPALWQAASQRERSQFLRHLRCWWDVHRHRIPLQSLGRLDGLRADGRLEINAGRIVGVSSEGTKTRVQWRPRGASDAVTVDADIVVSATGPDSSPSRSSCPLTQATLRRGLAVCDELGLGWKTDPRGRLLRSSGEASQVLWYAGPWLRAQHWEATAVPELRTHVDRTVRTLIRSVVSPDQAARKVK